MKPLGIKLKDSGWGPKFDKFPRETPNKHPWVLRLKKRTDRIARKRERMWCKEKIRKELMEIKIMTEKERIYADKQYEIDSINKDMHTEEEYSQIMAYIEDHYDYLIAMSDNDM